MNPDHGISTEGNDPVAAAARLGDLIDKMIVACPDATILVAKIINLCDTGDAGQKSRTQKFQSLIPGIVRQRRNAGAHIQTVDFSPFTGSDLRDCVHPTNAGYKKFGDYWYDFITQIPRGWITPPQGPDPVHDDADPSANGGIDENVPPPNWGADPVQPSSKAAIRDAAKNAANGGQRMCNSNPTWYGTGQIALGLGSTGNWQWHKNWTQGNKIADGLKLDPNHVR